ncbi:MAG TPA: cyclic nucleotide-binding domain-containing protein [Thermoanaerobaculia bacterium]
MTAETAVDRSETYNSLVAETLAPYETLNVAGPGTLLFQEGAEPEGVYFLHSGEVDLCFSSPKSGEAKSLLVADAGQILGLASLVSGRHLDCTATTRSTCITGFIPKDRFLSLLDEKPALWLTVLRMISSNINSCWDCMRSLSAAR